MRPVDGTAWRGGRFDGESGPGAILFGRMYEDPMIELDAFVPGGRVLCIASAGCTARSLSQHHEVVAVDINPVQLAYARRRLDGAPAHLGAAERVMGALRALLPLAGIARAELEGFLALSCLDEQRSRWRRLCTRRFQLGVDALLSVAALRVVYASPFLEQLPRRFGRVLLARLDRGFALHPNRSNPYARALFLGEHPEREEPAAPIELVCEDVAAYLEAQPPGSFTGVTLSNILDGATAGYRSRLFEAVRRAATADAMVVVRSFAEPNGSWSAGAAARDRSMLWGVVHVARARALA